uniref:Dipeptidase n=1 Tax=Mola mola TaxID=94237 RepID=A0A3Q3XFM8_MOLML
MKSLRLVVVLSSLCILISGHSERERLHDLMFKYPLIDGHNDLALQLRRFYNNELSQVDLHNVTKFATDINRLRAGHVQAQMFAVYVMCGAQEKDAVRLTLEQIDVVRRMCTEYQEFELVTSVQGIVHLMKHKIACLISIEGGHSIDSSLPTLRMFYLLGVRSMSLTHSCNTPWKVIVFQRENNSLTHFGKVSLIEMNRLGMIVDLSHTAWDTASAVLKHSKAPVIFSHSSSYFICHHHRNVPDWILLDYSDFSMCFIYTDHFDHIKKLIGAESIGIGADFEGAVSFPQGLDDVSKYPDLIQELLQRNWTENEVANILRGNFLRVFEEVERVSLKDECICFYDKLRIPVEEVQNPCRLVLRPPKPKEHRQSSSSRAHHGPKGLLILAIGLLLSSFFMDE